MRGGPRSKEVILFLLMHTNMYLISQKPFKKLYQIQPHTVLKSTRLCILCKYTHSYNELFKEPYRGIASAKPFKKMYYRIVLSSLHGILLLRRNPFKINIQSIHLVKPFKIVYYVEW